MPGGSNVSERAVNICYRNHEILVDEHPFEYSDEISKERLYSSFNWKIRERFKYTKRIEGIFPTKISYRVIIFASRRGIN